MLFDTQDILFKCETEVTAIYRINKSFIVLLT